MNNAEITRLPEGMPTLRVMPMPSDANIHGDVFGGWIMAPVSYTHLTLPTIYSV